jgi:M6 family metalloprotease-like protein
LVRLFLALAFASAVAVTTALTIPSAPALGAAVASCTYEQKQQRTQALERYRAAMSRERAAYFRRNKAKAKRAAFVRRQQQRLRTLRASAACTVAPLPPSSTASCSFMLAPNQAEAFAHLDQGRPGPLPTEGPIAPGSFHPSLGRFNELVLLVDFVDRPATERAEAFGSFFKLEMKHLEEVSYGRFTVTSEVFPEWIRMPRPASSYPFNSGAGFYPYLRDAITAADARVDFSRYQAVMVVAVPQFPSSSNGGAFYAGRGVPTADGVEIRFVATLTPDARFQVGGAQPSANHEFLHTLGLPDLRFSSERVQGFDPMGDPPTLTHLLGWHKWRFGWLDAPQLTCVQQPGVVEETITSLALNGGKKLVVVPTSASTAYVIEARTPVGYDRGICDDGVLVYFVDSQLAQAQMVGGHGVLDLKGPKECGVGTAGAFETGETFEDALVRVEVVARTASAFRVRVTKK